MPIIKLPANFKAGNKLHLTDLHNALAALKSGLMASAAKGRK